MKNIFIIFALSLIVVSCSKKEEGSFEAFSPEAFAYDIGDAWEINATVNVKGFEKKEVGDEISASFEFTVDITGPDSLEIENVFNDSKEVTDSEIIDVQLESQFEFDYDSPEGLYKITFNVTDMNSGEKTSAQTDFELKK